MTTVGIRDLKAHLSRHLRSVRGGTPLRITDRGRTIATIQPVTAARDTSWARALVAAGRARWNGGKPRASAPVTRARAARTASSIVVEDRR